MLKLDRSEIKDLSVTDADSDVLSLDDWKVSEDINVSRCIAHLRAQEDEDCRITDVGANLFEEFKLSPAYAQVQCSQGDTSKTPPSSLSSSHSPNTQQNRSYAPNESFRKRIKRYSTIFNTFKDGKQWDSQRRHLKATSMTQDIDEVLSVNHSPISEEDKELFKEKQKFMCSVFAKKL